MSEGQDLDESLRRRLQSLADQREHLPMEARLRTVRALEREARQLRTRRYLGGALGAVALAAAAALALFVRPRGEEQAPAERVVAALPQAPACSLPAELAFADADGAKVMELPRLGALRAEASANVRMVRGEDCALEVQLDRGLLAGELKELGEDTLVIRTPLGKVRVRGTTFSVRAEQELEVVLMDGKGDVVTEDRVLALAPGQSLRKPARGGATEVTAHSPEQVRAIWTLLAAESSRPEALPPVPARAPEPRKSRPAEPERAPREVRAAESEQLTADALLQRAEAERKSGRTAEARSLYRTAATLEGLDAEVAALRWVRFEVEERNVAAANEALALYRARFASGRFLAEAAWLAVRTHKLAGRTDEAKREALTIVRRYPNSAQARAAQSYLDEKP